MKATHDIRANASKWRVSGANRDDLGPGETWKNLRGRRAQLLDEVVD
jgi:hypothetical protein